MLLSQGGRECGDGKEDNAQSRTSYAGDWIWFSVCEVTVWRRTRAINIGGSLPS